MKKVLFVIPEYSHGGTNKSLENLLSFMDKSKYDIHVYSMYEDGGDYYKMVFKPYIVKKSLLYYFLHDNVVTRKVMGLYNKITKRDNFTWLYKREANLLQSKYHYDTVVAYQEGAATYFASYIYEGINKIAWIHCDYKDWANEKQIKKDKAVYALYNKIVCVSETAKKSFCEVFPQYKEKSVSIYNSIDCEALRQMSGKNAKFPYSEEDNFNIISVGRLSSVKQFSKIPSIVSSMKHDVIDKIRWYIIGAGSQKEVILNEITKHGLEKNIILLGPKDNPYPYFRQSNLYVCTSDSESFSYTIFESKILHTPVVSNNFPVACEVLDKDCGWVCSLEEMPALIDYLINDKDGIYSKVKKSIEDYEYDNKSIVQQIETIL